jgi:hypothetical protein
MDTGFCPKCVEVDDEQPIIKEEKVIVMHKPIVKIPPKKNLHNLKCPKQKRKRGFVM